MNATTPTVIRYGYEADALGDLSATDFEAELYDALKARFPGAVIDIVRGSRRVWGTTKNDTEQIDPGVLRQIGEDVFAAMRRK